MDNVAVIRGPAQPTVTAPTVAKGNAELGKEEFLQLLVTQLRHQDPMNPSDPQEFASQLAQYSSLEQLMNLNETIAAQAEASATSALALKASLGASLIGRQVLAVGDRVTVRAGEPTALYFDVGGSGGRAAIRIVNAQGVEVAMQDIGTIGGGRQRFIIDAGRLPPGQYTYEVAVVASDGSIADVTTYVAGTVDGVQFQGGTLVVRAGGVTFPLDSLVEIEGQPAAPTTTSTETSYR